MLTEKADKSDFRLIRNSHDRRNITKSYGKRAGDQERKAERRELKSNSRPVSNSVRSV
jgi:hypothetical protein